jgi:ATP-binding cassette subfamily B protein
MIERDERRSAEDDDDDADEEESDDASPYAVSRSDMAGLAVLAQLLWRYGRPFRRLIAILALALLLDAALNVCFPVLQRLLIDDGLIARDQDVIVRGLVLYAAAAIALVGVGFVIELIAARVVTDMIASIRSALYERVQGLALRDIDAARTGALVARFSGDIVAIEAALIEAAGGLLLPLIEVLYTTILMFVFSFELGLIAVLIFPLTLLGPRIFVGRAVRLGYLKRRADGRVIAEAAEGIAAQKTVRAFGLEALMAQRFAAAGRRWRMVAFRFNLQNAYVEQTATASLYLLHIVVFVAGVLLTYRGVISVGTFVAFEAMFLSMGYALNSVTHFFPELAHAAGSALHLADILDAPTRATDTPLPGLGAIKGDIRLDGVRFAYGGEGFAVDIAVLDIAAGEYVVVVGATGAGKSTLIGLLLGLIRPEKGVIRLDGCDVAAFDPASVRARIGAVFQANFLFHASIRDNIAMGKPGATMAEIVAAAKAAEVHDFIVSLKSGYDTVTGERGARLSGGQQQRIAIARALVRDPAILLLDEATSALDSETEAALMATIAQGRGQRTIVFVTHRLVNAAGADRVIVMDNGRVVESGRHHDLIAARGRYAALWADRVGEGD